MVVKNKEKRAAGDGWREIDVRATGALWVTKAWEWRLFFRYLLYFFYMCKGGARRTQSRSERAANAEPNLFELC